MEWLETYWNSVAGSELFIIFAILFLGYAIGRITICGLNLGSAGVLLVSIHARKTDEAEFEAMCARLAPMGLKIAVVPGLAFCDEAETLDAAKLLNTLGAIAARYGIRVCYHNHTSEFFPDPISGKPLHEILLENTDPALVSIQLDVGWACAAGVDVPAYLRAHPGRFASIHVKECSRILGTGTPRSAKAPAFVIPKGGFKPTPEMLAEDKRRAAGQCPMGAEESMLNWCEIDAILSEQGVDALWVIERENDYYDGNTLLCLQEDVAWLHANL